MDQIYSDILHPCFSTNGEKTHTGQRLCSSHPFLEAKVWSGWAGPERRPESQLPSWFPHLLPRQPAPFPCSCPQTGFTWDKDSWDDSKPREGSTLRCHPRSTRRQRRTERARTDCGLRRSDSETSEEANPGPSGLQSPSKFVHGEPREAGVYPTVSPPALCAPQPSSGERHCWGQRDVSGKPRKSVRCLGQNTQQAVSMGQSIRYH